MVASTTKDLFGDEEEDQQHLLEDYADDDEGALEPRAPAAAVAPAAQTAADRRAALHALSKQKRGAATDDASPQDKKKRKRDKDKKRKGDSDAGKVADGSRPRRDGRPKRVPAQQQEQRPTRAAGEEQEVASDELEESADDQDFIDDEGERPHGSYAWAWWDGS